MHARSGGKLEVMGLMQGKIDGDTMIVMDSFALPVEGTETRVNAQVEAYEYMVSYLELIGQVNMPLHLPHVLTQQQRADECRLASCRPVALRTPSVGITATLVMVAGFLVSTSAHRCSTSSTRSPGWP